MKIGIAQINTTVGDLAGNRRKILTYSERGEREGVDLVVFPELAITGYPIMDLTFRKDFAREAQRELDQIAAWSRGRSVALAVGGFEKAELKDRKGYNTLFFIQGGQILARQRKSLLPTYDVFIEEMFFKPGSDFPVIRLKGQTVGGTVCEDIWDEAYTLKPLAKLREGGAGLVVNASASPFHAGKSSLREELVRTQAARHRVAIVLANLVGGQDDLIFDGRSLAVDRDGNLIARGSSFSEDFIVVELDTHLRGRPRDLGPQQSEEEEIYAALCLGLRDYVRKNGFAKVVIGLSGGVDSSLVAAIAADALGPENVVGVSMPGPYSSPASLEDARLLARNLKIAFRVRPIRARYRAQKAEMHRSELKESLSSGPGSARRWLGWMAQFMPLACFANHETDLASENLQARLRGELLMYVSNAEGCLVLSTGNKSELAMGYCTLYGDMCGGLSVLADVYKTQVWRLARYRNRAGGVIPEQVIQKAPSAELKPNQTDQDSLPPYEVLDVILHDYIEEDCDVEEIARHLDEKGLSVKSGLSTPDLVRDVVQKVDQNEYKRRQGAPTLRVSPRAWYGRRMPITNKFNLKHYSRASDQEM